MNNKKHYTIYAHINLVNQKVYIGQTSQFPLSKRWKNGKAYNSCRYFQNAINKYGWDNFAHVVLEECYCDQNEINEKEKYWIALYDSKNPDKGYNITSGGYSELSPLAKLKAEEWKANHPEFLQQRVQDIHKWQNEHPDEMLEIRRNNVKKATAKRKKPVVCVETGILYESASDAARQNVGTSQSKISQVCNGIRKMNGGFHWKYAE